MNKQELVKEKHLHNYNCAQAFLCAYSKELNIAEETLSKLSVGLGRGIGGLEENCCVPVLLAMLSSYFEGSDTNLENPQSKLESYACAKCMIMDFKEKVGSLSCKEILLKNIESKGKRDCSDILQIGISILEECRKEAYAGKISE